MGITFDYSKSFIKQEEIEYLKPLIQTCHELLHNGIGIRKDFTGWIDLPIRYDIKELERIKDYAGKVRENTDAFVIVGIGGSYLGARAAIEALNHNFYNNLPLDKRKGPQIYYVGNNMSGDYLLDLLEALEHKDVSINVISKSGTTLEPAIAFRILKEYMENRYGVKESRRRIYITTDSAKGALREFAKKEDLVSFTIHNSIGGRYSVFTAVGLFPIAVSGIDIDKLMKGALDAQIEYSRMDIDKNISYQYALMRNILYNKGKVLEILVSYEPSLHYFAEWWKQLFGESEGKNNKGIFPASASFTTDLHSLGQIIQDGRRNLFETNINIFNPRRDLRINTDKDNIDGLNYLSNKTIDFINKKAFEGTVEAHYGGDVPNLIINVPALNEYYLGKLTYLFKKSCAISGYLLGVNPFDQPGVEKYKSNMFKYLGKPGHLS